MLIDINATFINIDLTDLRFSILHQQEFFQRKSFYCQLCNLEWMRFYFRGRRPGEMQDRRKEKKPRKQEKKCERKNERLKDDVYITRWRFSHREDEATVEGFAEEGELAAGGSWRTSWPRWEVELSVSSHQTGSTMIPNGGRPHLLPAKIENPARGFPF